MIPSHWTPYRRPADRELVGYLVPSHAAAGQDWVPVTLFGYPLGEPAEREDAERVLAAYGLSCLAEPWELARPEGEPIRVKIREVTAEQLVVVVDDFGYGGDLNDVLVLQVPEPGRLTRCR